MMRRLLVPVVFSLGLGAWGALLWPAPAGRAYALRVRLGVALGPRAARGASAGAILDDIGRRPGLQDQLSGLLRGQLGVPDKLNALLSEPGLLQGVRFRLLHHAHLITDDAPDPPPDWLRSWARLEVVEGEGLVRHIDIVLSGDDPEWLRLAAPCVAGALQSAVGKFYDLGPGGTGPRPWETAIGPATWDPPGDSAAPRRRLALSLSCLALAAAVGVGVRRQGRRPKGGAPLPAPPAAPCGAHDSPPPVPSPHD
jgi:hypothetical protein